MSSREATQRVQGVRRRQWCCEHGRSRSQCKEGGGSGICEHGRRRNDCRECGGSSSASTCDTVWLAKERAIGGCRRLASPKMSARGSGCSVRNTRTSALCWESKALSAPRTTASVLLENVEKWERSSASTGGCAPSARSAAAARVGGGTAPASAKFTVTPRCGDLFIGSALMMLRDRNRHRYLRERERRARGRNHSLRCARV